MSLDQPSDSRDDDVPHARLFLMESGIYETYRVMQEKMWAVIALGGILFVTGTVLDEKNPLRIHIEAPKQDTHTFIQNGWKKAYRQFFSQVKKWADDHPDDREGIADIMYQQCLDEASRMQYAVKGALQNERRVVSVELFAQEYSYTKMLEIAEAHGVALTSHHEPENQHQ